MSVVSGLGPRARKICALLLLLLVFGAPVARAEDEPGSEDPETSPVASEPAEPESDGPDDGASEPTPSEDDVPLDPLKPKRRTSRFYVGGWLGASGGDVVDLVEFAPEVGYRITPKFHIGGSLIYRYRKDKRFDPDLTTEDVGGSVFGRYLVYGPLFVHLGVERITWDFIESAPEGPAVTSADHMAVLAGPGFALPLGPNAATYFTILYDLNYDNEGPNPYDRPWFIRIGVGVGL